MAKFLEKVSGKTDGSAFKATFTSGAETKDIRCAQFFMKMQDEEYDVEAARSYANIGPMVSPGVDWGEINRVLDTYNDVTA